MASRFPRTVSTIKNGTVIDHITAGQALTIVNLLQLDTYPGRVTLGLHFPSTIMGHKDIIKIEAHELTPEEGNQVAILAPEATISIIQRDKVIRKFMVALPETIEGIVVCPNRNCITNCEELETAFHIQQRGHDVRLRCHHCQKVFSQNAIKYRTKAKSIRL